jgi:hypothetical protein
LVSISDDHIEGLCARSCRTWRDHQYAHSLPGRPQPEWEQLRDHLRLVTETCARFAGTFGWAELARVAGLLHDTENAPTSFRPISRGRGLFWRALFQQRRGRSPSPRGSVDEWLAAGVLKEVRPAGGKQCSVFPISRFTTSGEGSRLHRRADRNSRLALRVYSAAVGAASQAGCVISAFAWWASLAPNLGRGG